MTLQRKPLARSESVVVTSTFDNALAILASHRPDALLEAVAMSAKELLRSFDLVQTLPNVIERIGRTTGVDRVHILEIDPAAPDQGRIIQHHLWCASGISAPPRFRDAKSAGMGETGLESWPRSLAAGKVVVGHVRGFAGPARKFFKSAGVKSAMVVPVFSDGHLWGHIRLDDCRDEREWSPAEIDTFKTLAELVGAAVARTRHLETLADANRIIENSPTILYRLSPQKPFKLIYLSQNVRRYGYEVDELLASPGSWFQLIESEHQPAITADIQSIIEEKTEQTLTEFRLKKADGSYAWLEGRGYAVRDAEHRLVAIEGILTDVTERKRSESALSFSHILLATAIESSRDAVLIVDASDRTIIFNQHFIELWSIPSEVVHTGTDAPILKIVASRMKNESEFVTRVRYLYDHPEIESQEEIESADGRVIERHSRSLYNTQRKYLGRVWFFRDITERKRSIESIAALARTDSLTGLPNRTAFLERLNLEFARARRGGSQFAVHYLDLDHFKDVNDTLGHPVGDALLRAAAERLTSCVRETDMVARFGGDEFAVLQDDIADTSSVETLAAKIGEVLAVPFAIKGNQVQTTASIGIVLYRSDVTDVDAMMMKADLALYRAKNEGRNQFRFHVAELDEQTREQIMIGGELRHAVERGEFELYYQPQVELKSGWIVGLEALIRWNHPTRGLMLPTDFIPIAETTGNVVSIGEWVIEQACRQFKIWSDLGTAPPIIAVNLSGAQFKLVSQIDQVVGEYLLRYNVAPERLELELTESVLFETTQRHREAFDRLRQIGVRFAIDDFGTGYSSLDYLRSFRVSRLKIDRRFIDEVTTSRDDAAIVRATIALAHELGIEVVAEGVETVGQRDFLISAGCKFAQGYYFGKAVAATVANELLRQNLQFALA